MKYFLLMGILIMSLSSCEELTEESAQVSKREVNQVRGLNSVKYISTSISDAGASATFQQSSYQLSPSSRLLLRLEGLSGITPNAIIDNNNPMIFKISPSGLSFSQVDGLRTEVRLCPLTKNWMMLATWNKAHPFPGGSGRWTGGGEFDESACLYALNSGDLFLSFDVSEWYAYYAQSLGQNFGWVIISEGTFTVWGDGHSSEAPKLEWTDYL